MQSVNMATARRPASHGTKTTGCPSVQGVQSVPCCAHTGAPAAPAQTADSLQLRTWTCFVLTLTEMQLWQRASDLQALCFCDTTESVGAIDFLPAQRRA